MTFTKADETVSARGVARAVADAEPGLVAIHHKFMHSLQAAVTKITIMTTAKRFSGAPTKRLSGCEAGGEGNDVADGSRVRS